MGFVPAFSAPLKKTELAWWFAFCQDKLLVKLLDKTAVIPCLTHLESLALKPVREQYLGTLNGRPCYSAELAVDISPPEGMIFQGLRQLFGLIDEELFRISGFAIQIMNWDQKHQYCGRCGTPTEIESDERAKICPKCGFVNFPRISPAIIVAVLKDNQILLARSPRFPHKLYSVIAGFVEPGETLEECVKREVREEIGIQTKNIRYFGSQSWPFPNSLMIAFTADYAHGKIKIDKTEIVDAGWFRANNLPLVPDKVSISRRLIDWFIKTYP